MLLDLKKQETIKIPKAKLDLNMCQHVNQISWLDAIVSGHYTKHPDNFVYIDLSENLYTVSLLAKIYPDATFYHNCKDEGSIERNLHVLNDNLLNNTVQYIYLGDTLSFCSKEKRTKLYQFIIDKLAPGGYVVISYEAATGWSEYQVILDLIKEMRSDSNIEADWLDKVFYELITLSLKKISIFKNKVFLDKLLVYLKSLTLTHLTKVLCSPEFYTFYPHQIHKGLNPDHKANFRFVGALPLIKNYVKLGLDQPQKEFVGNTEEMMMALQRHDLITMPFHNINVWQKNPDKDHPKGSILDFNLGCVSIFDKFSSIVKKGNLTFNFTDNIYTEIRQLLNKEFLSVDEIIKRTMHLVTSPQEIVNRLMLLVCGDQVRYSLQALPSRKITVNKQKMLAKIKFICPINQNMFSDIRRFLNEKGVVIHKNLSLIIPFDSKTSMIIAALTKIHENLVPQYCAEVWAEKSLENMDIQAIQKEFRSILLFFKRHYLGKFLELSLVDQVLVE